jgi:tetratricopeptide (TPR) repeat protein
MLFLAALIGIASVSALGALDPPTVQAANQEAHLLFRQQEFGRARELAARTLERARAQGDHRGAGFATANLAATLAIVGRVAEALPLYEEAEELLRQGGSRRDRGRLAVARGLAFHLVSEPDQGNGELERARTLLGAGDWRRDFASVGIRYWADLAVGPTMEESIDLLARARQNGDQTQLAAALMIAGGLEGSVRKLQEAVDLFEELGQPHAAALGQRNIGIAHLRQGELEEAGDRLEKALEQARAAANKRLEFIVLNDLSVVRARAGDQRGSREADLHAEAVLAELPGALQQHQVQDTLMLDSYHLLRLRYLTTPGFLPDLFPWLFDQLALDPTSGNEGGAQ